jgi:lipopolysaccharide/colanic/teichoic acid biosynthesis glycosyltransferase
MPGLTCFWQVRARGAPDFDDWVRLDLRYVERRSPICDLGLLAATVPAVLLRKGAR